MLLNTGVDPQSEVFTGKIEEFPQELWLFINSLTFPAFSDKWSPSFLCITEIPKPRMCDFNISRNVSSALPHPLVGGGVNT